MAFAAIAASPANADTAVPVSAISSDLSSSPLRLNDADKGRYGAIYAALRDQKWMDAKAMIGALDAQDAFRPVALAELYLARNSPRVELFDLLDLIDKAPWLAKADQLSRLAQTRGHHHLPVLPQVPKKVGMGGRPGRTDGGAGQTQATA